MTEDLIQERRGASLIVTISRPHARNAVSSAVAQAIAEAMDEFERDDSLRVAVLTGAGGTFSSGMDMKEFTPGAANVATSRGLFGITERPPAKPIIAAVEGWALAGGFEMALSCDLIVAAQNARFGIPEVKRGLVGKSPREWWGLRAGGAA